MLSLTTSLALVNLALSASAIATPHQEKRDSTPVTLLTDINVIKNYWGQVKPYNNTPESFFGVENVGLPYGCGYE